MCEVMCSERTSPTRAGSKPVSLSLARRRTFGVPLAGWTAVDAQALPGSVAAAHRAGSSRTWRRRMVTIIVRTAALQLWRRIACGLCPSVHWQGVRSDTLDFANNCSVL
jgi:hypothetical protein